jgi:hypothetical protein
MNLLVDAGYGVDLLNGESHRSRRCRVHLDKRSATGTLRDDADDTPDGPGVLGIGRRIGSFQEDGRSWNDRAQACDVRAHVARECGCPWMLALVIPTPVPVKSM